MIITRNDHYQKFSATEESGHNDWKIVTIEKKWLLLGINFWSKSFPLYVNFNLTELLPMYKIFHDVALKQDYEAELGANASLLVELDKSGPGSNCNEDPQNCTLINKYSSVFVLFWFGLVSFD